MEMECKILANAVKMASPAVQLHDNILSCIGDIANSPASNSTCKHKKFPFYRLMPGAAQKRRCEKPMDSCLCISYTALAPLSLIEVPSASPNVHALALSHSQGPDQLLQATPDPPIIRNLRSPRIGLHPCHRDQRLLLNSPHSVIFYVTIPCLVLSCLVLPSLPSLL